MSFSKAKIIRFNEVKPCAPSPANSNLLKDKITSERPKIPSSEVQSPATSENGSVNGSTKSVPGTFKTPTLPKRTKTATSVTKIKPKDLFITNDLEALKEKTVECENKTKYILELSEELENLKHKLEHLKKEKEQLQREHQNEIQDLEFEMLKTMTKLQKLEEDSVVKIKEVDERLQKEIFNLKKAHEYQIGQVVLDCEIKLKDFNEDSELKFRQKLDEAENSWKQKLSEQEAQSEAILKECQAISEYNIIQCELEKQEVKKALENAKSLYETLERKYNSLLEKQDRYDKSSEILEKNLTKKISILTQKLREKEDEIKKLLCEIKAYQITINNSQVTIEVLKKRLINSDRDVEQLKSELAKYEERLIEYESRYFQVNVELKEAKDFNEELEMQYESAIKLNESSINQLKEELLNKVHMYEKEVRRCLEVKESDNLSQDIIQQLNNNIATIHKINLEVDKIEEFYDNRVGQLEGKLDSFVDKKGVLIKKVDALTNENVMFKNELQKKDETIKTMGKQVAGLQEKNDKLNITCQYYKSKSAEFEAEAKDSSHTRKKYIDISGKYDVLLQKFESLKLENVDCKSKMNRMEKERETLKRMYEKIKKEKEVFENENVLSKNKLDEQKLIKYKFASKDKENIGSPNRSVIESPNRGSPFRGSPFKERN